MRTILLFIFLTVPGIISLSAQSASKKTLGHEDVASWNKLNSTRLSNNGQWAAYVLAAPEGDKQTYWHQIAQDKSFSYTRAERPAFSADGKFLAFMIKPAQDSIKNWKLKKVSKKEWAEDTLAIVNLSNGEIDKIPNVKSFEFGEKWSDYVAIHLTIKGSSDTSKVKPKNGNLVLYALADDKASTTVKGVKSFKLASKQPQLTLLQKEGNNHMIKIFDATKGTFKTIWQDSIEAEKLMISDQGDAVAFLTEGSEENKSKSLYLSKNGAASKMIADAETDFLPEDWGISASGNLSFSEKGDRLFFGIAPNPEPAPKDVIADEVPNVEVWHYKDPQIYPQQKINLRRARGKTYPCVFHLKDNKFVQLGSLEIPNVRVDRRNTSQWTVGYNDEPYQVQTTWQGGPSYKDVFLINQKTGQKEKIASTLRGNPSLSPEGKYVYWYNSPDSAWFVYNIEKKTTKNITKDLDVPVYDELNDRPMHPRQYGSPGWTTNDDFFIVYDRYDIWLIDPSGNIKPLNPLKGRETKTVHRYIQYDFEKRAIEEVEPMLIYFIEEETSIQGYLWFNIHTGKKDLLQRGPFALMRRPIKAKEANQWLFSKENYNLFPDLIASEDLRSGTTISNANPQIADYNWGNIKHVTWTSLDGQEIKGLLATPDDFDPNKQYPMIVNFYERSSQGIHRHRTPEFNRSTINYPFYTSRGYIIFNPDVPYRVGYPGESAYNAVVSGVTNLIDQGFVDKDRIALQGHSWGGYQIAHIITKTDMFKCVESGAPVVNMFSAYGGIRWGSGVSRQFQYEHTQSRIGGTIWDYPIRYLENSPLFFMDKVNTPVLILHNDNDSAVPWYQGIEFFMAMRRLNKPAWMLNYNDEPHWPLKYPNRKDFQMRMQQFFDYYLMDAPMPKWMATGVPALKKKVERGYEPADKQ